MAPGHFVDLTEDWENQRGHGPTREAEIEAARQAFRATATLPSASILELWSTRNAMSLPNPPLTKEQQSDAVSLTRLPRHHGLFESMSTATSGLSKSNESRSACHIYFLHLLFFNLLNLCCWTHRYRLPSKKLI